jgi:transposase
VAVRNPSARVATEALGSLDLRSGLATMAIEEVKRKKKQKCLTGVRDYPHWQGPLGCQARSKETRASFFEALGGQLSAQLHFVTCDGVEWIHTVVKEHFPQAIICRDAVHLVE